ncbi:TolC family protein [Pseudoflavitalea sp. G-6-1-2]|uniref:TolC family protein n=1 Tax=Pseudoflavitalea sp. G-6-1-2 TaxID=2728841 RepID=UPI00146ADEC7|nr:TolC family protein [Pseudoflavitalea sp. G-6-1-2]NML23412.1 TolC family protein [Pseudoflavitalea sp. G-6-1-2]
MQFTLRWLALLLVFMGYSKLQAQTDTLKLNLPEAEKIFLQKNLVLLAQQYNISISKALEQQARYWDNPTLNTDQTLYDGKFFRHSKENANGQTYGEIYLQLQQVIRTAGKRNKLIKLSEDATLSASQQFSDLLRNLKFTLATQFSTLGQLTAVDQLYARELESMQKLVQGMDAEFKAGNISQKENLRIKALLFSLQNDRAALQQQIADIQKDLHVLLQMNDQTIIIPAEIKVTIPPLPPLADLIDTAMNNRPDLQLANTSLLQQQHNLAYQKSLVAPDVTAGVAYDRLNSYVPHYWGIQLSVPLPILNQNKGNINAAKESIKQADLNIRQAQTQISQDVTASYRKFLLAANLLQQTDPALNEPFDKLLQNMISSYRQRQVSLVEFIDFFDSYKEVLIRKQQQIAAFRNAAAELNFSTGANVVALP